MGTRYWRAIDGALQANTAAYARENQPIAQQLGETSLDGRFQVKIYRGDIEISYKDNPTARFYYDMVASNAYFFPDGEHLMVIFYDGEIWFVANDQWESQLLELEPYETYYSTELQPVLMLDTGLNRPPTAIAVSPDGSFIAFGSWDHRIQIWQVADLTLVSTLNNPERPTALAFSIDNTILAVASAEKPIHLWDLRTDQVVAELGGSLESITGLSFSSDGRLLASSSFTEICLWGILPTTSFEFAQSTATAMASAKPTAAYTPVSLPQPTPIPTNALPSYLNRLPLAWPAASPSQQQIEEASSCYVQSLAGRRYPSDLYFWQLETKYPLETACDWAALAVAYGNHRESQEPIAEEGKRSFIQAYLLNPAFAFSGPLMDHYFGSIDLVEQPPFTKQPITSLVIDYQWRGLGEPSNIAYHIEITQANQEGEAQVSVQGQPVDLVARAAGRINPNLVKSFGSALVDFLPIHTPVQLDFCIDDDPQWLVEITFLDGTQLTLDTFQSDVVRSGGPWQTSIDGQYYLQYSAALIQMMAKIFDGLNLEFGWPYATYCRGEDPLNLVYP